ncbi:MAG: transposase, partial [Hydrogenobaculum sp.]
MNTYKFDTNKHSVFLLYYHLILVVKYRRKVINQNVSEKLKEMFI